MERLADMYDWAIRWCHARFPIWLGLRNEKEKIMAEGSVPQGMYLKACFDRDRWKTHATSIMEELTACETEKDYWKAIAESSKARNEHLASEVSRLEKEIHND